ncbi:MAG: hypothetical protein M3Y33_16920 [Actinomycetota bacterium]|nr:hypothetical protein [Actinomycetota bacterium]
MCWLWLSQMQAHPAYLTHLLPAQVGTVLGVAGLVSILARASAAEPPADLPARCPADHRVLRGHGPGWRRPAHPPLIARGGPGDRPATPAR